MKKTIICLGMALLSFTNVALASGGTTSTISKETAAFNVSPLCMAISKGDMETVRKFIEYGADVNESGNGMTPLMVAARYNRVEIIKFLLEKGADTSAKDDRGNTALRYAELSKSNEAFEYLKSVR